MKNISALYLELGLSLMVLSAYAMDNQLPLISPSKLRTIEELDLEGLVASGVFNSPAKSPIKAGKQEVSPLKIGGMTQAEIDQLASSDAFNSPQKSVAASTPLAISPAGRFHVGFPQKFCFADIAHASLKQMEKGDAYTALGFQIPDKNCLKVLIDKVKQGVRVNMIVDKNALIKDQSRSLNNQSLKQLQDAGANVLIFNAQQNLVDSEGSPIVLHAKEEAFTKKGHQRVFGLGSHNKTAQAVRNEEMCVYSKDPQDYNYVTTLFERMKQYSTSYKDLVTSNNNNHIMHHVMNIPRLPVPPLFSGGKLTISTDQANWAPIIENICEKEATHISSYSIGNPYLTSLVKNKNLQQIIVNAECYNKNSALKKIWQDFANTGIGAYVFSHPINVLHTKFALLKGGKTLMSSANFMPNGFAKDINTVTLTDDATIYAACKKGFQDQIAHEDTKKIMPINHSATSQKRKLDNNSDALRNDTSSGVKRNLFK